MKKLRRQLILYLLRLFGKDTENFAPHGVPVHIPSHTDVAIRYLLARGRPYEAAEASLISQHLSKGTDVIELGGCMGVVSALIRQTIGPEAQLVVVEANPELAAICKANATGNFAGEKTTVIQGAVDYSGKPSVTFATGHNAHVGHIAKVGENGFTVPTTTLSSLTNKISDGDFALVCDIEGTEISLVEKEVETLKRVSLLVLETHPNAYPRGRADLDAMCATLEGVGLQLVEEIDQVLCFKREPRDAAGPSFD